MRKGSEEVTNRTNTIDQLLEPRTARALRERAGLSQLGVANAVGVWPRTVTRWENGDTQPRGKTRARYARLLNNLDRKEKK